MDITFVNVGYGEAILIECDEAGQDGRPFVMLIDGGSGLDEEYAGNSGRIRAVDFLRKKGIGHIDIAVFSHVHEDHTCGLERVLAEIPAESCWTSIALDPAFCGKQISPEKIENGTNRKMLASLNAYSRLMDCLPEEKIIRLQGIHPGYLRKGELVIDVLGPEQRYKECVEALVSRCFRAQDPAELDAALTETTESMNNASLILKLGYKGKTVLLCADTNAAGFGHVLAADPELLRADVYKVSHHGQPDSVSAELVKAIDPSVIVCCASNDYRSNSSSEKTFGLIREAMGEKQLTWLFQDGLYNEQWNADTAPRNGVTVHVGTDGIRWERC